MKCSIERIKDWIKDQELLLETEQDNAEFIR